MSESNETLSQMPLKARIQLSHAYFQRTANLNKIDILHIKGYAFGTDAYREGRLSSDVDLLVRPAHLERFMYILQQDGWEILTHFETGSIFEHASTIYHPSWGLADIHRYFPGVGFTDPIQAFNLMWQDRRKKEIAHYACETLSVADSRLLVVVHDGRSLADARTDTGFLKQQLTTADWAGVRKRAVELDAELAFDTGLGQLERHKANKYYLLWKSMSEDVPAYIGWVARLRRAQGVAAKVHVVYQIFVVNEDHLAMELGHKPSRAEVRKRFLSRFGIRLGRKS